MKGEGMIATGMTSTAILFDAEGLKLVAGFVFVVFMFFVTLLWREDL